MYQNRYGFPETGIAEDIRLQMHKECIDTAERINQWKGDYILESLDRHALIRIINTCKKELNRRDENEC